MKRICSVLLTLLIAFGLSGCALFELIHDKDLVTDLGNGDEFVRWTLVQNDNECRPVNSAYFEFNSKAFKYYENGVLKKEGTHRITFFGSDNPNLPLHLNLDFGRDGNGFSVYDYIDCYTEDGRDTLRQFTIVSEGYHIEPIRSGGVPVRDYHLSDMPYALGTYVKEGAEQYTYQNGKVNYFECAKLDGTFYDELGNKLYFVNNSYSPTYASTDYSQYTVYVRYENNTTHTFVEGTISMSRYEDFWTGEPKSCALIYVMHGDGEPGEEKGTYAFPDYQLTDFYFGDDGSLSFSGGEHFPDDPECDFDPGHFVAGRYQRASVE